MALVILALQQQVELTLHLVAVRASTSQSISSGSNTKVQLDTEMIDTDNTFDSSTNYRWSPGVAGKYYMTGTVSLNINVAGKYMQALIYKNGSTASYQQIAIAEGTNADIYSYC